MIKVGRHVHRPRFKDQSLVCIHHRTNQNFLGLCDPYTTFFYAGERALLPTAGSSFSVSGRVTYAAHNAENAPADFVKCAESIAMAWRVRPKN